MRSVPGNRWDLLDGAVPAAPPRVSVVVVHFEQPAQLARTLAALARQTHPADRLEVLVVDDGSAAPPAVPPGVRLLGQEDRGFRAGAARNLGARHATGEVLCFLDADTAPEPEYVARLTRLPALVPEAVTVGRRRHAAFDASPGPVEELGPRRELPAPAWLAEGYGASRDLLDADDRSYRFVISAVLACSAAFFRGTGGFDEAFGAYGGEDWEWAHRAWLAGALLAHVPDAVAWHDGPEWAGRTADDAARQAAKNAEALLLTGAIPVAGSRGRAVRGARSDVHVVLETAASPAAAFVCADGVLAALPEATVVVPDAVADAFTADTRVAAVSARPPLAGVRVVVRLPGPVRVEGPGLRAALDRLTRDGLGSLTLQGEDGAPLARLVAQRAAARAARRGTADGFPELTAPAEGLAPLPAEPDLEAWLGGWG